MLPPASATVASPATAATATYRGRGVHYFAGSVRCPLAGVGTRADDACNRLVLDQDGNEITVDHAAGRITVRDDHAYRRDTRVADVVSLAQGFDAHGACTRFTISTKVHKTGRAFSVEHYCHLRDTTPFERVAYTPLEIVADGGGRCEVLVDRRRTERLVARPTLASRVSGALTATRDHLAGVTAGDRICDVSVGIGMLGVDVMLVRAQLMSLDRTNAPLIARGVLADMLRDGAWEIRITALAEKWLSDVIRRDLFVFGLEDAPILRDLRTRGLRKGQRIGFRRMGAGGELLVDDAAAPLPNVLDVARAYIEFHPLGGMIARATERAPERPSG